MAPPDRRLDITSVFEDSVLRIRGQLDAETAGDLQARLNEAIEHQWRPVIVVDVLGMTVTDDADLGVFADADAQARQRGGRLTLTAPSIDMLTRLEDAGLGRMVFRPDRVFRADGADCHRTRQGGPSRTETPGE